MEDMRKFEKPEMEVIVFEAEDIITVSDKFGASDFNEEDSLEVDISTFDGGGNITETTAPTTSAGAAEAADSPADSNVAEESVVEDEHGIEEPVMTEEVVEEMIEE